jgi:hypothetical protein
MNLENFPITQKNRFNYRELLQNHVYTIALFTFNSFLIDLKCCNLVESLLLPPVRLPFNYVTQLCRPLIGFADRIHDQKTSKAYYIE